MSRPFGVLLPVLLLAGCLTTPAEDASRVTLLLSFAQTPVITGQSPDSWFLQATLTGADLERPLTATVRGLADSAAGLTFTNQSGGPRRLTLTYFYYDGETVETWTYASSDLHLVPGDQTISAVLQRAPEYTLTGLLGFSGDAPTTVWLQDLDTDLDFPVAQVVPSGDREATFTLPRIPVGRFFRLIVRDAAGQNRAFDDCPVFSSRPGTLSITGNLSDLSCELR
jgi:hypothetical protein